jgi:hypothetical protein
MRNFKNWVLIGIVTGVIFASYPTRAEEIICPGTGERCAQVKVLFFHIWKMKEKGGPGIIIIEEE